MSLGQHIRGSVGMGLAWGTAWFGAGVLVARVSGFDADLPFAYQFAPFGVATGVGFSEILASIRGRKELERQSLTRFSTWGAVCGLLPAVAVAALRGQPSEFLTFGPLLALVGAGCGAASLIFVRRTARNPPSGMGGDPAEA